MKVTVFLPCRKRSQRVIKKNTKPFGKYNKGLLELKLNQLLGVNFINKIILSTDDEEIINFSKKLNNSKILIHHRDADLASNECSTDKLVSLAVSLIPQSHILWTHVTSPFIDSKLYTAIIKKYFSILKNDHDSLMTVNILKSFLWNSDGPSNYSRKIEKWPRTQTLDPLFEVNSGVFLASSEIYLNKNDRIGSNPYLYKLNKIQGFDIDEEDDFQIAEVLSSKI